MSQDLLKVAIIHFHLNRGGVTQVVLNHLRALEQLDARPAVQAALLYGGRREGLPPEALAQLPGVEISLHKIAALDYDHGDLPAADRLYAELKGALDKIDFLPANSLLHIHNHSLGKNISLPGTIDRLVQDGYPLLLQIHDFAEDFRPDNYRRLLTSLADDDPRRLSAILYPQSESIHYAVLNGRDLQVLRRAGVADRQLHLLPNAAGDFGEMPSRRAAREKLERRFGVAADQKYILYPVRGIRRKNVGEAVLWSALGGPHVVAITLPPINPAERVAYDRWKKFVERRKLPCLFDVGAPGGLEFKENLVAADMILTTSVAEGFGMVFLEAWLAGKKLIGRDLPEITEDFKRAGMRFADLRAELLVPIDWVGESELRTAVDEVFASVQQRFGRRADRTSACDALLVDGKIDFAALPSWQQMKVVDLVCNGRQQRDCLLQLNPWMRAALDGSESADAAIDKNAATVRGEFSLAKSGQRLLDLYTRVAAGKRGRQVTAPPNGTAILASFLEPSRLHAIRLEN